MEKELEIPIVRQLKEASDAVPCGARLARMPADSKDCKPVTKLGGDWRAAKSPQLQRARSAGHMAICLTSRANRLFLPRCWPLSCSVLRQLMHAAVLTSSEASSSMASLPDAAPSSATPLPPAAPAADFSALLSMSSSTGMSSAAHTYRTNCACASSITQHDKVICMVNLCNMWSHAPPLFCGDMHGKEGCIHAPNEAGMELYLGNDSTQLCRILKPL